MNYTIYVASHDYGNLFLDKEGNKYVIGAYISGFGITHKEEFDNLSDAEIRYFEMCSISNIEPVMVEHELADFANID